MGFECGNFTDPWSIGILHADYRSLPQDSMGMNSLLKLQNVGVMASASEHPPVRDVIAALGFPNNWAPFGYPHSENCNSLEYIQGPNFWKDLCVLHYITLNNLEGSEIKESQMRLTICNFPGSESNKTYAAVSCNFLGT